MDIRKKKQKNVEPGSPNSDIEGDAWIFTFITRWSYLIVAYEIGKRTKKTCETLFEKVFDRVQLPSPDMKIEIFSDGHDDYTNTIPEYYAESCVDYRQLIKIRKGGKVVDKIKKVIYGTPKMDEIETTDIENMNGICRERQGRLVRKTKCFSKKRPKLINSFEIFKYSKLGHCQKISAYEFKAEITQDRTLIEKIAMLNCILLLGKYKLNKLYVWIII